MNAILRLAFYFAHRGNWLDREIAAHDGGPFSHVELWFDGPPKFARCFSSSGIDGGVRYKSIDLVDGKWATFQVDLADEEQLTRVGHFCWNERGKLYDFAGVLGFKLPWIRDDRSKWFCSEICTAALQVAGLFPGARPERTSPNQLFRLVTGSR